MLMVYEQKSLVRQIKDVQQLSEFGQHFYFIRTGNFLIRKQKKKHEILKKSERLLSRNGYAFFFFSSF